ncbi:MAG: phage major capsid protein [Clostridia bacterium]|nr:phage major capsid protein [Clostridia bacterium]MBR6517081.1 phage major capsid protein [Bacilli bacterium]
MPASVSGIVRNDVDALIETQVANEIFEGTIRQSKALSMFKRLPNATSDKTKLRVLDSLPVAYFVDETTNNGRKNITKLAWDKKYINIAELAVIVPIKENLLNDSSIDIWATVRPRVEEAFARKIDNAMFFGIDKPTDWRAGLVPSIATVGAEVEETSNGLYSDINDAMVKVEESGYNVNGILGGTGLKGKFRMMLDTTGQPLNTTEIGSIRREFMDNGVWDKTKSTLVVGDFSQAVYAIRQDITYKVLTEAVIQDPSDGSILYNLAQDDMVALRVVMRLGWEIPNPVNAENETETRFPFASLKPEGTTSL